MAEHGKYCPIMVAGGNTHVSQCIGKDCAWWLPYANDCALPVVAGILADSKICQNVFEMESDEKFISKSQMEELEDACTFGIEGANKLLKKYAGIQARAYTAYNYYDENDDFLANSDEADIYGLLEMAGVEVRHGG